MAEADAAGRPAAGCCCCDDEAAALLLLPVLPPPLGASPAAAARQRVPPPGRRLVAVAAAAAAGAAGGPAAAGGGGGDALAAAAAAAAAAAGALADATRPRGASARRPREKSRGRWRTCVTPAPPPARPPAPTTGARSARGKGPENASIARSGGASQEVAGFALPRGAERAGGEARGRGGRRSVAPLSLFAASHCLLFLIRCCGALGKRVAREEAH
jgi:hypothetical protein